MATDADPILNDLIARVGHVRRWLLALGVLKTAALWLTCLSIYIAAYALIDHHVHFEWRGRLLALGLLIVLLGILCRYLVKMLRRDMTYTHAANHVESRQSFDQQLVAVIEFYEGKSDYPYSKSLARQLVVHVGRATEGLSLDATVDKWHGYVLAACVLLCLSIVGLFVRYNVRYFTSYLTRLVRPFSQIEPVPTTAIESITGDTVTEPNVPVALSAAISGHLPDSAALVLTRPGVEEPNGITRPNIERIPITPQVANEGQFTLAAAPSFDRLETVSYHFEAGDRRTEPHTITVAEAPAIRRMTATVTRPGPDDRTPGHTYTEEISDGLLEVLPDSRIQLQVQACTPLQEAAVAGPDGQATTRSVQSPDTFGVEFMAEQTSTMEFSLISDKGLPNSTPQRLRVRLKSDETPQFKLLSPESDYLATNVASIPIVFQVTDDFGLTSAQLCCELPDGSELVLDTDEPEGAKDITLSDTLELEQYDLEIGDSILFYARAADIGTGPRPKEAGSASEIYFIEIRPYQQYWHPQPGGGESPMPGPTPEDLITILEYTRAIVKRTWTQAQKPNPSDAGQEAIDDIRKDVAYCAFQTAEIRDDPNYGFVESAHEELNAIIALYSQADDHLVRHDAEAALAPERQAYRALRKFIDELHLKWNPPMSGQSIPEDKPERVTLQEQPDEPRMEAERVEKKLEELRQQIEKLTQEQESIKADLADTLQTQRANRVESPASETATQSPSPQGQPQGEPMADSTSLSSSGQAQHGNLSQQADRSSQGFSDQGQSTGQPSPSDMASRGSGGESPAAGQQENSDPAGQGSPGQALSSGESSRSDTTSRGSSGQGRSEGKPTGRDSNVQTAAGQGQTSQGQSGGNPERGGRSNSARTDARLRMLEAKQKSLNERASRISSDLEQVPGSERFMEAAKRDEAQRRLDQAIENLREFEDKLTDIRYNSAPSSQRENEMTRLADSAIRQLGQAGEAIKDGLASGRQQDVGQQAQALAEQLAEDAETLDESVDPDQQADMLERLDAAKRLLESMAGTHWATITGGGGPGNSHVYTRGGNTSAAEAARLLSRKFWSIAVQARDRQVGPVQDEPSDMTFFELENEFFEQAAKFRPEREPQ